jgi:hypothetical protein
MHFAAPQQLQMIRAGLPFRRPVIVSFEAPCVRRWQPAGVPDRNDEQALLLRCSINGCHPPHQPKE